MVLCAVALAGEHALGRVAIPGQPEPGRVTPGDDGHPKGSSSSNPSDRTKPENPAYPAPAEPTATGTAKP